MPTRSPQLFKSCVDAFTRQVPIERSSAADKEFAVQNWVGARLDEALPYQEVGRNTYPDFPLTGDPPEGFEVKSLRYPGRDASYDANSNVPTGEHAGLSIYYVFVRYQVATSTELHAHDLVICHGDFLNPMRGYVHLNRNIPTFGAYGDIMIRDRKMYVVRTPFNIVSGLAGQKSLILLAGEEPPEGLVAIAEVERREADTIAVGYAFDLRTNQLELVEEQNPSAGVSHRFVIYRAPGEVDGPAVELVARVRGD